MQGSHFHFPCSETVGPLRLFESHRGVAEGAKQVLPPSRVKGCGVRGGAQRTELKGKHPKRQNPLNGAQDV